MTNVKCIVCGKSAHISYKWAIYFENYSIDGADVAVPEIGVCQECFQEEVFSRVDKEIMLDVREELEDKVIKKMAEEIEERVKEMKERAEDPEMIEDRWEIKKFRSDGDSIMTREEFLSRKLKGES